MSDEFKNHYPLPKNTHAFICANCGAVAMDAESLCLVQGRTTKAGWCGSPSIDMPPMCKKDKNTRRFRCKDCGRIALNPELLCKPELVPTS